MAKSRGTADWAPDVRAGMEAVQDQAKIQRVAIEKAREAGQGDLPAAPDALEHIVDLTKIFGG